MKEKVGVSVVICGIIISVNILFWMGFGWLALLSGVVENSDYFWEMILIIMFFTMFPPIYHSVFKLLPLKCQSKLKCSVIWWIGSLTGLALKLK